MPYRKKSELPDSVKDNLPSDAQKIYKEAFNNAHGQYGNEQRAHKVAWAAVKKKYKKNSQGNWVKKS